MSQIQQEKNRLMEWAMMLQLSISDLWERLKIADPIDPGEREEYPKPYLLRGDYNSKLDEVIKEVIPSYEKHLTLMEEYYHETRIR